MVSRSSVSRFVLAATLLLAVSGPVLAGEVYGKVTLGGSSVGGGATIGARCGETSYAAQPTDKSGRYHLIVGKSGKCSLIVTYKGASASLDMVSNEDAVQYDIELEMKDGTLVARRK
jgi:hypothetical protein